MLDTREACRFACLWMRVSVPVQGLTVTTAMVVAVAAFSPIQGLAATGDQSRTLAAEASPAGRGGAASGHGRSRRPLVLIAQVSAPPTLPGLGQELARSLRSVLGEAGVDARVVAEGQPAPRGESDHTLSGRIEDLGGGRLRLTLSWHGSSVQAMGDVEHLDDMAYAACEGLRPRLVLDAPTTDSASPAERTPESGSGGTVLAAVLPAREGKTAAVSPPAVGEAKKRPVVRPAASPVTPASVAVVPAVVSPGSKDKSKEPEPSRPNPLGTPPPPSSPPPPASPPPSLPPGPVESAPPAPQPVAMRPRIAVHLVGEPVAGLPPAFYGAGAVAQQTTIAYLQNRLRYPTVASRLTGLVGGLDALSQSLRLGARHTLMARFDTLVDGFGSFGTRTVSGRMHVVLLLDGRPLLDRSLTIPPSAYYPTEPAAQVIARIVTAALDAISGELAARLGTPLPAQ